MRALSYSVFGPANDVLQITDLPSDKPRAGEVRVRLQFSGVNPSDVKARAGARPGVTKPPYPHVIPHSDGAGVIDAVGAGVDETRIGQPVWIWNGQWQRAFGTAAETITLPASQAVPMPDGIAMETGAVLGIPGLTACHAVFGGGAVAGDTVLVQGGAGTVGYLAVQLAKWGGARVIATCAPDDRTRVEAAGADVVVNYRDPRAADAILEANGGDPVHRIVEVEFGRNIETDTAVIAENGSIAAFGSAKEMSPTLPFYALMFKAVTLDLVLIYLLEPAPRMNAVSRLHDALTEGGLSCPVEAIFDLSAGAKAHQAVEAGARDGAILLRCDS